MNRSPQNPADIALDAWQSAGITLRTIFNYTPRWTKWQEWCDAKGINPLGATHDQFARFGSEQKDWTDTIRRQYSGALHQPYRHVNKPNPARLPVSPAPTTQSKHTPLLNRFEAWCKTHGVNSLPAPPEDVAAFLKELAKSHSTSQVVTAAAAIGRLHTTAGYAPPSEAPAVTSALKEIQGTPKPAERHSRYYERHDRRRTDWTNWCLAHGYEPEAPTADNFRQYMEQLATRWLTRATLSAYRHAISEMYDDPAITWNDKTSALINAAPTKTGRSQKDNAGRRETEAEIQVILHTEARLMEQRTTSLPVEKRMRVAQAIGHADINDQTLHLYVRHGWLPFKRWCKPNDTSTETATPADVAAFLCELADEKTPYVAYRARDALHHVFNRVRPYDNPADNAFVRKTVQGLKRERPSSAQQAEPIGKEAVTRIIETANIPKGHEREPQTRLRAAVDIALICTMYDALLRGKEASEAEWHDLKNAPDGNGGSILTIRRSKTDPLEEGAVAYLTKPTTDAIRHMQAVRHELGIGDTGDPRIFRLGCSGIYRRIGEACKHAGLEGRYTKHSPRVGGAQDLALDNVSEAQIMNIARWKSSASAARYTRKVRATQNAVAQRDKRQRQKKQGPKDLADDYGIVPPYSKARLGH